MVTETLDVGLGEADRPAPRIANTVHGPFAPSLPQTFSRSPLSSRLCSSGCRDSDRGTRPSPCE